MSSQIDKSAFQRAVDSVKKKRVDASERAKEINKSIGLDLHDESVNMKGIHDEARDLIDTEKDLRRTRVTSGVPMSSKPYHHQNYPDSLVIQQQFRDRIGNTDVGGMNRFKGLNPTMAYYTSVDDLTGDISPIGYKKKGGELTRIPKPERQSYLDKLQALSDRKGTGDLGLKLSSTSASPTENIADYFNKDKAARAWRDIDLKHGKYAGAKKIGKKVLGALPFAAAIGSALLDSPEAAAEDIIYDIVDPFGILTPSEIGVDPDPRYIKIEEPWRNDE